MKGFAGWLHDLTDDDPYLAALKGFADANIAVWPYWSDTLDEYKGAIRNVAPAPANRDDLLMALSTYFERWSSLQRAAAAPPKAGLAGVNLGKLALALFGLVVAGLLIFALMNGNFYDSLGKTEQVRGMVTFFFVVATTGIIILFAISIFWIEHSTDVTERFKSAKDLLTIVIGVLGTIMGFYFGSATSETANMSIASMALSPPVIHAGESATLSGRINGGAKPYTYTVVFTDTSKTLTPEQLTALKVSEKSADGAISKEIKAPAVKNPVILFYALTATDSKNVNAASSGALYIEPAKPAAATPTPSPTPTPTPTPTPAR